MKRQIKYIILLLTFQFYCLLVFSATKTWTGSTSTTYGTSSNWSPSGIPGSADDIIIPTSPSGGRWPHFGNGEDNRYCRNFTIQAGASYYNDSSDPYSFLYILGSISIDGSYFQASYIGAHIIGGTLSTPCTIGGNGSYSNIEFMMGFHGSSYYKLASNASIWSVQLFNSYGCYFDMFGFDLSTQKFGVSSSTTFKQGSGTLRIEGSPSVVSINDASFLEQTGTTYFGSGTNFAACSQTIPSISYYNLKARTNSGYTVTLGSVATVTVAGNFEIIAGSSGGSVSMANNNVNVSGNLSVASGSTLNLNGTNNKTLTIGGTTISNSGVISGFSQQTNYQLMATGNSVTLDQSGTWNATCQFQKNLTISNTKIITINGGYFRLGLTDGWIVTNNGTITGSSTYYHLYVDRNYTVTGTGTYSSIIVGYGGKAKATLGADLHMTGKLGINDNEPDEIDVVSYDIYIGGDFINGVASNSIFTPRNKKVIFNGSNAATIEGTATTTFYNLEINKDGAATTVTNASTKKAFQVSNDLTVTKGKLVLEATDADYGVTNDVSVSSTGTLKHSVLWTTPARKLVVGGDFLIDGAYDFSAVSGALVHLNGTAATTYSVRVPNSAMSYLCLTNGDYYCNGNLTVNNNFWAMWNSASGEFHTNGYTVTANNGVFIDGGTVFVNGGMLDVTASGLNVGYSDRAGILNISSGTARCNSFNNGDGTRLGATTFSGGTLDVNGNITLNNSTTFVCSNTNTMTVAGDWVNKGGTFNPTGNTVTFDGSGEQHVNVTVAGGTTPYNSDFSFNNVAFSNGHANGVILYYKDDAGAARRIINFNDVNIISGKFSTYKQP